MACKHGVTRWVTREVMGEPRDIRLCQDCTRPVALGNWRSPLGTPSPDHCANCGGLRTTPFAVALLDPGHGPGHGAELGRPRCPRCGLTRRQDRLLHLKLARDLGSSDLCEAAELAATEGRHVLALKLATAAIQFGDDPYLARAVRLQELSAIGRREDAIAEARAWLEPPEAPAFVAGIVAELLLREGRNTEALAALDEGLGRDPLDRTMRLDRAELFEELGRQDDALEDARHCLGRDDEVRRDAIELVARVAEDRLRSGDPQGARDAFAAASPQSRDDARLCYARACAELADGRLAEARRWMKRTLELDPSHAGARQDLYDVDEDLGRGSPARSYREP